MQDLFSNNVSKSAPLADRMRPQTLDEFIGQRHIVGEGCLLRRAIKIDALQSSIFWGPPGCGKTTLASIIANTTRSNFVKLNAVTLKRFARSLPWPKIICAFTERKLSCFWMNATDGARHSPTPFCPRLKAARLNSSAQPPKTR